MSVVRDQESGIRRMIPELSEDRCADRSGGDPGAEGGGLCRYFAVAGGAIRSGSRELLAARMNQHGVFRTDRDRLVRIGAGGAGH